MAEGGSIENKSLEELESEITCGICQEHYAEPKILPCLHYYCKQCILTLAQRSATDKPFYCPECRCATSLPEGGVDQLKTAFFINRLKSKVTTIERVQGKVEVKCELCVDSTSNAEAFCRQCAMFICKECVLLHTKLRTYMNHEVVTLDDLKRGRAKAIHVKEPPTKKCEIHEKSLKIFCFDCDRLICQHCTVKDHREHNFEFTKKAARDVKTRLLDSLDSLKELSFNLGRAGEQLSTSKNEIDTQNKFVVNNVRASFKELREILDKHECKLVDQANKLSRQKKEKLSIQEKNLSLASAEVQSVVEYTERCVSLSTDNEVMSMHTEVEKAIQQKIQEHNEAGRSLEPVEVADMGVEVKCAEALKQLCQTQAIITKLFIDPAKCTVDLPEYASVYSLCVATLITRLSNNEQAKGNCKISSQVKSLHNGIITDCNIEEEESGRYLILYSSDVRGRHELTVLIDGQHVPGSPFPVYVFFHPILLGKPIKVWGDLNRPLGITTNANGDILVTESRKNILKLTADGRREKVATVNELKGLRDIACDDEDNFYCVDQSNDIILKSDKNGGNRKTQSEEGVKGRWGLCVTNDELLVAQRYLKGMVKVYDQDLEYVRAIQHKDMGEVAGLATDLQGNIYASDFSNCCIQVFNRNGDFKGTIGGNRKIFKRPWGIFVSDRYVYVTDVHSHCVCVITTDGEYVTSIGQKGAKQGEFNCPVSVCIDKDGFVFVCDHLNNRIQCF